MPHFGETYKPLVTFEDVGFHYDSGLHVLDGAPPSTTALDDLMEPSNSFSSFLFIRQVQFPVVFFHTHIVNILRTVFKLIEVCEILGLQVFRSPSSKGKRLPSLARVAAGNRLSSGCCT